MKQIKLGQIETLTIKNKSINSIALNGRCFHGTANTAFAATEGWDYDEIDLEITLSRGGKKTEVYRGKVLPLAVALNFEHSMFNYVFPHSSISSHVVTLAATTGVKEQTLQPCIIPIGQFNLVGSDVLEVKVKVGNSALGAESDSALSYIELDEVEAVGYEKITPIYEVTNMDADQNRLTYALGDNIQEVYVINTNKLNVLEASQVVENVLLKSDKQTFNDSWEQLICKRSQMFATIEESARRYHSFRLLKGEDFDDVEIDINQDTTNADNTKNYLVVKRFDLSLPHFQTAQNIERGHVGKFADKLKGIRMPRQFRK